MEKNEQKSIVEGKGIVFNFTQPRDISFRGVTFIKAESVSFAERNVEVSKDLGSEGYPIYNIYAPYGIFKRDLLISVPVDYCCIFQNGELVVNKK